MSSVSPHGLCPVTLAPVTAASYSQDCYTVAPGTWTRVTLGAAQAAGDCTEMRPVACWKEVSRVRPRPSCGPLPSLHGLSFVPWERSPGAVRLRGSHRFLAGGSKTGLVLELAQGPSSAKPVRPPCPLPHPGPDTRVGQASSSPSLHRLCLDGRSRGSCSRHRCPAADTGVQKPPGLRHLPPRGACLTDTAPSRSLGRPGAVPRHPLCGHHRPGTDPC